MHAVAMSARDSATGPPGGQAMESNITKIYNQNIQIKLNHIYLKMSLQMLRFFKSYFWIPLDSL